MKHDLRSTSKLELIHRPTGARSETSKTELKAPSTSLMEQISQEHAYPVKTLTAGARNRMLIMVTEAVKRRGSSRK